VDYRTIKKLIIVELILLFAQFQMGMSVNLFLIIPPTAPLGVLIQLSGLELVLHIVNGFLIIFLACIILGFSIRTKNALPSKFSLLAIVFIVVAIIAGFVFFLNGQDGTFSMVMAMSYISVFTIHFVELYVVIKA